MTIDQPTISLADGNTIPQIGFGTYQIEEGRAAEAVANAIATGYRSIDTAKAYNNESGVGEGLRRSGVSRDELFVTTKLWNEDQGYDATLRAFDGSMTKLGLDVLDLYLIHWPMPEKGSYVDTWKAFVQLQKDGRIKSIGVSNFLEEHLKRIVDETGVAPVVNQIELHPTFQQRDQRAVHDRMGIRIEAWSPIGQGAALNDPVLKSIGEKYGKSSVQVALRWHVDSGNIAIPKSANPDHIKGNFDIFDFKLDAEDMRQIEGLDDANGRLGPDPRTFNG